MQIRASTKRLRSIETTQARQFHSNYILARDWTAGGHSALPLRTTLIRCLLGNLATDRTAHASNISRVSRPSCVCFTCRVGSPRVRYCCSISTMVPFLSVMRGQQMLLTEAAVCPSPATNMKREDQT